MNFIGAQERHVFWGSSPRRELRVMNPGLGVRRIFIGQTEPAAPQKNRLLDVRTNVILSRAALMVPEPSGGLVSTVADYRKLFSGGLVTPSGWTAEEKAALEAVAAAPTPEELADVILIDSFFPFMKKVTPEPQRGVPTTPAFDLRSLVCEGKAIQLDRNSWRKTPPLSTSPFYCIKPVPGLPSWLTSKPWEWFKLDPAVKWGEQRLVTKNAKVLVDTLGAYPLPSPLSAGPAIWYRVAQEHLIQAVHDKWPLDPQLARFMITLIVLGTYEQASNEIMNYFEHEAKKKKRQAIINAIVMAVFSLILPVIGAIYFGAVTSVIDANQARGAAQEMMKASKQFAETDAAFAEEIKKTAEIIDYQAAQEEAAKGLTPEEADAALEPGAEGKITKAEVDQAMAKGKGIPTGLLVGGGVAAAAAIAFAFLR